MCLCHWLFCAVNIPNAYDRKYSKYEEFEIQFLKKIDLKKKFYHNNLACVLMYIRFHKFKILIKFHNFKNSAKNFG